MILPTLPALMKLFSSFASVTATLIANRVKVQVEGYNFHQNFRCCYRKNLGFFFFVEWPCDNPAAALPSCSHLQVVDHSSEIMPIKILFIEISLPTRSIEPPIFRSRLKLSATVLVPHMWGLTRNWLTGWLTADWPISYLYFHFLPESKQTMPCVRGTERGS